MDSWEHELTVNQARYLSDMLRLGEKDDVSEWRLLMLKVMRPISDQDIATVHLTADELWTIRDVAKSSAQVGTERVGLELLEACARGLLTLAAAQRVEEAEGIAEETGRRLRNARTS